MNFTIGLILLVISLLIICYVFAYEAGRCKEREIWEKFIIERFPHCINDKTY